MLATLCHLYIILVSFPNLSIFISQLKKIFKNHKDITNPCLNPLLTSKYFLTLVLNLTHDILLIKCPWTPHSRRTPQFFSANFIIRLLQVLKCDMQFLPFIYVLLNQLLQYKYLINTSPSRPKSSSLLRYLFFRTFYYSSNQYPSIYFSRYTQYTYCSIISTISAVTFLFVYRDDTRCLPILWYNTRLHISIEYPQQPVSYANGSIFIISTTIPFI